MSTCAYCTDAISLISIVIVSTLLPEPSAGGDDGLVVETGGGGGVGTGVAVAGNCDAAVVVPGSGGCGVGTGVAVVGRGGGVVVVPGRGNGVVLVRGDGGGGGVEEVHGEPSAGMTCILPSVMVSCSPHQYQNSLHSSAIGTVNVVTVDSLDCHAGVSPPSLKCK